LGEIQAIGGVNEKIEGFFEVCLAKGLTGEQGVIIPRSNEPNLMLKESLVEAVQEGKFHIWSVSMVDEGLEILTGVAAGERGEDGLFAEDTVFGRVDWRLKDLAIRLIEFGRDNNKDRPPEKKPDEEQPGQVLPNEQKPDEEQPNDQLPTDEPPADDKPEEEQPDGDPPAGDQPEDEPPETA